MAQPAAVLSVLVKAQGIAQTSAQLRDVHGDLNKAEGAVDKFGGSTAGASKRMDGFRRAAGAAFVGGLGAATIAIKGSIRAASEAQVSQSKMETQLKALGISYGDHAKKIDDVIQKTSRLS